MLLSLPFCEPNERNGENIVSLLFSSLHFSQSKHSVKPSVTTSIDRPPSHPLTSLALPTTSSASKWPLNVTFNGWQHPFGAWKTMVDNMDSKYQSIWKEVGIYEAIMASKYQILRYNNLVFGVADKWCSKTNTFVFPWGEATVTLEDVMILGGYPVLGDSVSVPLKTDESKIAEQRLIKVRHQILKRAGKACLYSWIKHFNENDGKFEHEAFLSLWLSRFVFPLQSPGTIMEHVFPIAVHLARGKRIALAPVVLANIYRDLSLLKEKIVASFKLESSDGSLELSIWSPFQIVQIWAWERFEKLRPNPLMLQCNAPRVARWHNLKRLEHETVSLALDFAGEYFQWRPYAKNVENWLFPKYYREKEEWVSVDSDLDRELESFARCVRVCELVGLDCIEQYLPHRVAMQFGMDQDVPGHVARHKESPEIAWRSYNKNPVSDTKLYIPSRLSKSGVTTRYSEWWRQTVLGEQDLMEGDILQQRSSNSKKGKVNDDAAVPLGFPPKCNDVLLVDCSKDDENALVFPGFCPMFNTNEAGVSAKEDDLGMRELSNFSVANSGNGKRMSDASFQSLLSLTADNGGVKKMDSLMGGGEKSISIEAATGRLERVGENANESVSTRAASNSEVYNSVYDTIEIPGSDLEARISSLEKQFTGLKEKYSYNFGINSTMGGSSHL